MKTVESHEKTDLNELVIEYIHEKGVIFSDQSKNDVDLAELVEIHIAEKSNKELPKQH